MTKRSSTFSFERPPRLRGTAWAVAGLTCLLLLALELGARALGYTPSVTDDEDLLCLQLDRVHQEHAVVLVGASRIRAGFSAKVFRQRFPNRPLVNLALAGKCPLAMLEQLARDTDFHGTVIFAVNETCLNPSLRRHQTANIEYCKTQWSSSRAISRRLRLALEPRLALMRPTIGLRNLLDAWRDTDALPKPDFYQMSTDRLNDIDFSETGPEQARTRVARLRAHHRRHKPMAQSTWLKEAQLTDRYAKLIQERGGKVSIVRFPTTGEFWKLEQAAYPRAQYWDRFAAVSSATLIHFKDLPTANLPCGDQSHLDGRHAPAFTEALLDEIQSRGGLAP